MPVWRLLEYAGLVGLLAGTAWLATRILGVPSARHPGPAVVGSPWIEAEDAFDHALGEHRRRQISATLTGHRERLDLPTLDDVAPLGQYLGRRSLGERTIPLQRIIGSADGASHLFDRGFRPTDERARDRFQSIYVAMRTGQQLPSIDVYRWRGNYFVSDGLHRVAAARAMGQDYIAAQVTDLVG